MPNQSELAPAASQPNAVRPKKQSTDSKLWWYYISVIGTEWFDGKNVFIEKTTMPSTLVWTNEQKNLMFRGMGNTVPVQPGRYFSVKYLRSHTQAPRQLHHLPPYKRGKLREYYEGAFDRTEPANFSGKPAKHGTKKTMQRIFLCAFRAAHSQTSKSMICSKTSYPVKLGEAYENCCFGFLKRTVFNSLKGQSERTVWKERHLRGFFWTKSNHSIIVQLELR